MKTLIIVRHAKSSWDYDVNDKDRPLKERGINDAYLVANEVKKFGSEVEAVYSSPANRALHTCLIFLRTMGVSLEKLALSEAMYDFSGESVMHLVRALPNNLQTVMIFGHNYALTSVANILGSKIIDNVTTSGTVVIKFDIENWNDLGKGTTTHCIFPKQLR